MGWGYFRQDVPITGTGDEERLVDSVPLMCYIVPQPFVLGLRPDII